MSYTNLVLKVNTDVWRLAKITYPTLNHLPTSWPEIVQYLEQYRPKLHYLAVIWRPPEKEFLNDGASRGNPGRSTYGFCLQNWKGDFIYAQGEEIHKTTNIEVEAIAIREAIYHCITTNLNRVWIETDSLVLVKIISGVWEIPWNVSTLVEDIKYLAQHYEFIIQHVYREGNSMVDYIANFAFENEGRQSFSSFHELPTQAGKILNLEKHLIPNLRIRTKSISLHPNRGGEENFFII
ncbi:hypothetical protein KY285_007715 [Solanum tuberosum]|nr:hypothetical protein KY285_007715 [Solanum tuberosum]